MLQHALQAREIVVYKFLERRSPGVANGGHNAATAGHYLHVAGSGYSLLELIGPIAEPGYVGVGINETGYDTVAQGINFGAAPEATGDVSGCTGLDDCATVHGDRPVR
jgi:hypothetical protein